MEEAVTEEVAMEEMITIKDVDFHRFHAEYRVYPNCQSAKSCFYSLLHLFLKNQVLMY